MKIGFDNELYINKQSENILKRVKMFDKKLYIEFGGKLFDDFHASRVLPGFCPNAKINILKTLSDKTEIILCISSNDIERNKIREDFGRDARNQGQELQRKFIREIPAKWKRSGFPWQNKQVLSYS